MPDLSAPIKIWYRQFPPTGTKWPIVDAKFSTSKRISPQPYFSLIDSGADISILHIELANALGIDLKKLAPAKFSGKSVSGDYKFWLLPDPINVEMYGYSFNFKFAVIDNINLIWPCILGENSIFDVAKVDFQKFKGYFEIRFRQDIN